jgi:ribonuclease R
VARRRDFRKIFTLTIDPEDAKDFDDALSLRKLDNGNYEVGVHIADVSHFVRPGSLLDEEAAARGTSIYLVDRTVPMLPEALSNRMCSLSPHEDKLCFSAVFELDVNAQVVHEWFGRTVICSDRRYNYEEAQAILEGGAGDHAEELLTLHHIAEKLREERFKKGSIAFETEEVKFRLDENGKPLSVYIKQYKDSNKLIEDFMLLANRRVAEYVSSVKSGKEAPPFVYRVHDTPNPEKLSQFSDFIAKLGYSLKMSTRKAMSQSFNDLFGRIRGKGEENLISSLAIRTMAKAFYSTDNIGHYGLGFRHYTHFTSPIRRYPDLMVHRLLQQVLDGKLKADRAYLEHQCLHSSEMERKATEAERASIKYKQAEYLLDKVGQDFTGLVSGISKWGLYVELTESKCEGMISVRDMTDDYYFIDEENYVAVGQSSGKKYRLGDPINIRIKRIDLAKKTIDFVLRK